MIASRKSGRLSSLLVRAFHWCSREPVLFTALVLLHLIPVWSFRYLPTQDGPSHLANALMLKEYHLSGTRYHELFEPRWEAFPNWTSHLLLAGLLYTVPPLVAEKLLVSCYIIAFAWSFRYFLGSFGNQTRLLAPVGLLFVFNRFFLMGFYNYCLSLVFYWTVLGYCLRRQNRFRLQDSAVLMVLLLGAYFTHLVGFLLAAASALRVVTTQPPGRWLKLALTALALAPAGWLTVRHLGGAKFLERPEVTELWTTFRSRLWGPDSLEQLQAALEKVNDNLYEPYQPPYLPLGALVLLFFEFLVIATALGPHRTPEEKKLFPRRWPVALLTLGFAMFYFLLPEHFGVQGGFLRSRLVVVVPMLLLACLELPAGTKLGRVFQAGMAGLFALNLAVLGRYFLAANQDLAAFTAGLDRAGCNHTLVFHRPAPPLQLADYWEHAGNYYCLTTRHIDLYNYEAETPYFPLRYRPEVRERWHGGMRADQGACRPEIILIWDERPDLPAYLAGFHREVYRSGWLAIFERTALQDARTGTHH